MIRKSGLFIFVLLFALILGVVYFLIGPVVRMSMVYVLEKSFGAEVNIEDVSVGLLPASLSIEGLAITDRSEPTRNVISFGGARAGLEIWPALMGYYVIDELSVKGLAFGSSRSRPGEVYDRSTNATESDSEEQSKSLGDKFNIDLPSKETLLERMDLQTVEKGRALQEQIALQKQQLAQLETQLPDKKNIEEIERQINELTESKIKDPEDLARKTEQLKALQSQLRAERDNLKSIEQQIDTSRKELSESIKALREAKDRDLTKVKSMTDLKNGGLGSISQVLVGDVWAKRITQLESFYRLVEPYIPESSDEEDSEKEAKVLPNRILPIPQKPYPGFWVKEGVLHWLVGGGEAQVALHNLTFEHSVIGQTTRFNVSAERLPELESLLVDGSFKVEQVLTTTANWQVKGVNMSGREIFDNLGLALEQGSLNSTGDFKLVNDQLEQQTTLTLYQPSFSAADGKYSKQVATILNDQESIPLKISAVGELTSPDISINSNLDRLFGDAIVGSAKQKVEALRSEVTAEINEEFKRQLDGQDELLKTLDLREAQVEELDKMVEDALAAELKGLEDQAKDKIKEKLFNLGI